MRVHLSARSLYFTLVEVDSHVDVATLTQIYLDTKYDKYSGSGRKPRSELKTTKHWLGAKMKQALLANAS